MHSHVGTAESSVVHVEGPHAHWAVDGFGVCSSLRGGPVEAQREEQRLQEVTLLSSPYSSARSPAEQDEAVVRVARATTPGQSGLDSSDFTQEAGPVDLIGRALQVHGQKASSFTAVCGPEPQL